MNLKTIGLVLLTFILLACAVQAATNSYTETRTTTSQLSTSAWYSGVLVSNDRITYPTGNGEYISATFPRQNLTTGAVALSSYDSSTDVIDYAWLYSNTQWLNSTDARHTTGGHAFYSIRYPFYEDARDVWIVDSSSSHQDGTISGATVIEHINYIQRNYIDFDGADDYSRTNYAYDYDSGYWYIAAMIKPDGTSGSPIGISDSGSNAVIELQYVDSTSDYWKLLIRDQNNNAVEASNTSVSITPNAWHYVVMYADATYLYVYCDGSYICKLDLTYNSSSQLDLDYIQLGGIYFAGDNIADWAGCMDEFRFHAGYLPTSEFSSTGKMGSYMWNCVNGAVNPISANYKISGAGSSIYNVITGYTQGSFYVTDISITNLNTIPTYGTCYPDGIDYPSSDVTLRVGSAHDADISYTANITGTFYVDGVSKGTATITTDGNLDKNVGTQTGGLHEWYAVLIDPWGGSVTTGTYEFGITSTLYIKDEETGDLIDDAEVTVSFYTENTSVVRTSSNGTISLYGLPTSDMLVLATADGYTARKTIVFSLYDTNSIYLLNESSDIIYQKFVLNTQTISGSPTDYILKIQKPMNGTVNTVFSSYFDFDGVCGTYLIESDVYQLVIIAPDGTESTYGYLYPDPDGQIDIAYEGISFNEYVNAWLVTNTSINKDTKSISFAYDEAAQTNSLNPISVTEATMIVTDEAGNQVYNVTVTDSSYVFQYIAASDGRYNVAVAITGEDEDGNEFSYTKSFIVDFINDKFQFMPDEYPDWLKMLVITFLCLLILVGFGGYRSDLACGLSFGLYAFSAYQEWISVSALALGVLFIIVMAAFFKLQRKIKRSG